MILNGIDARERRAFGPEIGDKTFGKARLCRDADENALGIVAHVAGKPEARREPPHRRPEADALHQTADADLGCHGRAEGSGHHANLQSMTRLLPESAMTTVPPQAASP